MCCKRAITGMPLLFLFVLGGQAQSDFPLVRAWVKEPVFWTVFNAESYQPSGSFGFVQLQQAINQRGFDAALGYEQRLTRHWFAGIGILPAVDNNFSRLSYSLNLSRTGRLGKWQLLKQSTYILQSAQLRQAGGTVRRNYGSALTFMAGAARNFSLGSRSRLRSVFSYRATIFPGSEIHPRTIDQTRAQAELAWLPRPHYGIGLFVAQSTSYFIALARFDANGNMTEPDRRLNLNTAFIGLRLHLLLNLKRVEQSEYMRMLPY